jgi:hypothetical protein
MLEDRLPAVPVVVEVPVLVELPVVELPPVRALARMK